MGPGPIGGEVKQGDGIAAAREGDGEGRVTVRQQAGGQADLALGDPVRGGTAQPGLRAGGRVVVAGGRAGVQAKRVPMSVARVRWAAVAVAA